MKFAVLLDFGSTYTKVTCVELTAKRVVMTDKYPSTVHTDARVCLHQCLDAARRTIGAEALEKALKLSSSSAAGGLRMAVIGLTQTLSVIAGKNAAYGAGAKIVSYSHGLLDAAQAQDIALSKAEIVLLCGGYEQGNRSMVLHNAEMLAESPINIPVIYAGNSAVAQEIRTILQRGGKECFLVPNIIPAVKQLDTADTEALIRHIFMSRITNMMGLSGVQAEIGEVLMPTPAAVLEAGTLLSRGTQTQAGIGTVALLDVGGATTDVYSFGENKSFCGAKMIGVAEPYGKRTVEGDMGMRESSICIGQEVGLEVLAHGAGVSTEQMEQAIAHRVAQTSYLPDSDAERRIDEELASRAIAVSVRRHAGRIDVVHTGGRAQNQIGKNLTEIKTVIGTGGVIVNHPSPQRLMKCLPLQPGEPEEMLIPRQVEVLTDHDYVFYAAGLLRRYDEDAALAIMKASIRQ